MKLSRRLKRRQYEHPPFDPKRHAEVKADFEERERSRRRRELYGADTLTEEDFRATQPTNRSDGEATE